MKVGYVFANYVPKENVEAIYGGGTTLDEMLDQEYGPRGTRRRERFEVKARILQGATLMKYKANKNALTNIVKMLKWKTK